MKTTPILCLFGALNVNKVILHDKNVIFALHFTIQMPFEGFIMLLEEFKIINNEVCLISIQLSGGWGNLRGSICRKNSNSAIYLPKLIFGLKSIV